MTPIDDEPALRCVTHHACDCINATAEGARELIERYGSDAIMRATDLLRWAEMYGEPEDWVKRAQAAHMRAERAATLTDAAGELDRLREALLPFACIGAGAMARLGLLDEHIVAQELLAIDATSARALRAERDLADERHLARLAEGDS